MQGPYRIADTTPPAERVQRLETLAAEGARSPQLQRLAAYARAGAAGTSSWDLAASALRVAQRAGFRPDPPGEWFQSVEYTLYNGGDCEDLAALLVALFHVLGLRARVRWLDQPGAPLNHVSAQVWLDGGWQWTDPSICGARLGEAPSDAIRRLGRWDVLGFGGAPSSGCPAPAGQVLDVIGGVAPPAEPSWRPFLPPALEDAAPFLGPAFRPPWQAEMPASPPEGDPDLPPRRTRVPSRPSLSVPWWAWAGGAAAVGALLWARRS